MPSSIPISQTKIVPPHRRPELLSRGRLLRGITASLDRKLILISAPAGYGKTSLLVDLANSTRMPVAWLSLDELDRDPQRFLSYLVASLSERFPGLRAPMQPLLKNLRSVEDDIEGLIVTLTNELYNQVEQDFILIIDDFHLLDGFPLLNSILNRFLQLVDDNCHVVLATRTLPDLPDLTLMVARDQTEGLDQSELAFQPEEIRQLFHQNRGEDLTEQAALQLYERSAGWITGILLSARAGGPHAPGMDTFTYLGRQVLDQQTKTLREFLLRTSLLEEFDARMCEAVLGPFSSRRKNWHRPINELIEKNLFILRVGAGGNWIRYHPLFREFLHLRLLKERPEEVRPILERLTQYYESSAEWEKAYFTCQQLNDPEQRAGLVEHAGTPMLQHSFTTLESWVNSLPPGMLTSRPGLISLRGAMSIIRGRLSEAVNLLNEAERLYRQQQDTENLALVLNRRATALRQIGKYESSLQLAEEVMELTRSEPGLQAAYAEALRLKGLNLYRLGLSGQALGYLQHALALFQALQETGSIPMLLVDTGVVQAAIGNVEAATLAYQQALDYWQAENNLPMQAEVLNNIAILYHRNGEYEHAVETLNHALSVARQSHYLRAEALILLSLGDVYAEVGDYELAQQAYTKAQPITQQWPGAFIDTYLVLARARLAVLQQDVTGAKSILQKARQLQANPSLYERGLKALVEGQVHLLANQAHRAAAAFQESRQCFVQDSRELETFGSRAWLAAALIEAGDTKQAVAELQDLLGNGKELGHAALVTFAQAEPWLRRLQADSRVGSQLKSALQSALRLNTRMPALRRSLRRLSGHIEVQGPSLLIHAFGRGEVIVDGRKVSSAQWSTQSVRDLFFFFLCRGVALTKDQVAASLWPEEHDPQIVKQRFKTYLFRLRRATRRDVILFDDEFYRFNFGLDYEYDVETFETHLARARAERQPGQQIEHYRKAIALARGPYLDGLNVPWALGERDRLQQILIGALMDLCELQLAGRQLEEACASAQQALELDPYREGTHHALMRVYAAALDRPAIHRQYRACRAALAELSLSPSLETERLYQQLIK